MKINAEEVKYRTLTITLSGRETQILKAMLQNTVLLNENPEEAAVRRQLFNALGESFIPLTEVLEKLTIDKGDDPD